MQLASDINFNNVSDCLVMIMFSGRSISFTPFWKEASLCWAMITKEYGHVVFQFMQK